MIFDGSCIKISERFLPKYGRLTAPQDPQLKVVPPLVTCSPNSARQFRWFGGYSYQNFYLTEYCRSVTIVTKTKTTFFTRKIDQFHPKTGQFRHFFEVKNVVNFSNSSRQYSVNVKAKASPLLYL